MHRRGACGQSATAEDIAKLRALLEDAGNKIDDVDGLYALERDFHLAIAEASHNRVLVAELISLQHVSWPTRNRTLTPPVARHIVDVHRELVDLIEARDAAAARRLMDDHVKMIRTRRVTEHAKGKTNDPSCC